MDIEKLPKANLNQVRDHYKITYTPAELNAIEEALKPKNGSARRQLLWAIGALAVMKNRDLSSASEWDFADGYATAVSKVRTDGDPFSPSISASVGYHIANGVHGMAGVLRLAENNPGMSQIMLEGLSRQESKGDAE